MVSSTASLSDTWRVGVLFSRTGLTAVTETEHFLGTALAIQEINQAGGVLGREIEVVTYDPESDPETYRRLADRLLTDDGISVIFGCSSSAQRKAVLPAIERRNGLLWYPSLYEGFEYSPNVIYTGASPNQNSFPLAEYLVRNHGRRVLMAGSDYIYPRKSNRIMRDLVETYGGKIVDEVYVPMAASEQRLREIVVRAKELAPDVVFSTIVGRSAQMFYRLYREAGLDPASMPIASLTMAEGEVQVIGAALCEGHITAATHFGSLRGSSNRRFAENFHRAFGADKPISMWSAGAYAQVNLFALALERAGTLDTQRLVEAALGLSFEAPEGTDPDRSRQQPYLVDATDRPGSARRRLRCGLGSQGGGETGSLSRGIAARRPLDRRGDIGRMKPGIRRLIEELRGARVLVVHPRDAEGDALLDQLKRIGCNVRGIWPPPVELPNDIDTVFHLVETAETPAFVASASDDGPTFVAIVDYENPTVLRRLLDSNAHGVINKPIRSFGILSSLVLARSLHGYTRRLKGKVQKLEETLKARRDVDKAVKILVTLKKIGEAEAYELIRAQATQKRLSMAQIATTIIGAQDVMAGLGLIDEL